MFFLFSTLFSLLINHYVLIYGEKTAFTIDGKVMSFFSEIGFILVLEYSII